MRAQLGAGKRRAALEAPQKRIAIVVPCWHEDAVIGRMIRQNVEGIRYSNYELFIGVYPNDAATIAVVEDLVRRYSNVHIAVSPHDGPTSKADCLNTVWRSVVAFERDQGTRFEVIVTHDAEDVIHPDALYWINLYTDEYGMVQVPVLPLATPLKMWTHGVYCDEFAEYQTRDMPARGAMRSFIPSNGVGTGFRRDAVEILLSADGCVFDGGCLTEDYENGYKLRLSAVRQVFLPLHGRGMATRELFPTKFSRAVKQRTRWVTGIVLQTWQRHGWRGNFVVKYWLWRDRKGLINNPAGVLTNIVTLYAAADSCLNWARGAQSHLIGLLEPYSTLLAATGVLAAHRMCYRMACVARVYGWAFAACVPVRMVYGNIINSAAAVRAVAQFAAATFRGQKVAWAKTAHEYPAQVAAEIDKRKIGELLIARGVITASELAGALTTKPGGRRLGEHLVREGLAGECDVYDALSMQQGLPQSWLDPSEIPIAVARALPAGIAREYRVLPFRVEFASMFLAVPDLPTNDLRSKLRRYTMLDLRFHLVTPSNFEQLVSALL
jgi:bacteriophage N4 adsorption protein B